MTMLHYATCRIGRHPNQCVTQSPRTMASAIPMAVRSSMPLLVVGRDSDGSATIRGALQTGCQEP